MQNKTHFLKPLNVHLRLLVLLLVATCSLYSTAQERQPEDKTCEAIRHTFNYPYYYCDCVMDNTVEFQFGMDTIISDTLWFSATVSDLRMGMSAYWFSSKGIRLEVFALCSSVSPALTLTVGGNTMRDIDVDFINKKLAEMGDMSEIAENIVRPHLRVYPLNGGTGRVLAYAYDEGPHSTCEDLMPVKNGMTYISNHDEDIYAWLPADMRKDQQMFVQWQQKKNQPCTMELLRGSCSNPTLILSQTMSDSTKLFFPDIQLVNEAKAAGDTLYFRFTHKAEDVGRIRFRYNIKWQEASLDTTLCEGMGLQLADTLLMETTDYGPDTVWYKLDTVTLYTYHVNITPATVEKQTLNLYQRDLPQYYRGSYYIDRFGHHDVVIRKPNTCTQRVSLEVNHRIDTVRTTNMQTECVGKTIELDGQTFDHDTSIVYAQWKDNDTWQIDTRSLVFTAPVEEIETDTIMQGDLPYYYEAANRVLQAFGEYDFTVTRRNQCTRQIHFVLVNKEGNALSETQAENKARKVWKDGVLYIYKQGKYITLLGQEVENK
ncbi:MAG: hypothetical protein IJ838_05820 [Paludibacteraceae bacterium]|nr:hypothetical protein [Paludibacteraceae bacterium]